jgi:hypothetical protein
MQPHPEQPRHTNLVHQLLAFAATPGAQDPSRARADVILDGIDERQFKWVLAAGLGPLLRHAMQNNIGSVPHRWRDALTSAELTAQVRHAQIIDTAIDTIDACAMVGTHATLLKGISTSDQYYPAAHLRPMNDIDVLIPRSAYEGVESVLLRRGYSKPDFPSVDGMHHGAPLHHQPRNTWVELHIALFPNDSELHPGTLFAPSSVARRTVRADFFRRPIARLAEELQVAYIASSWMNDLIHVSIDPSFVPSLFDAVFLLNASGAALDWERLLESLDNEMAAASLYVMLDYLSRRCYAQFPPGIIARIGSRQRLVGPLQLRIIHVVVDHYLVGGRPWNLPVPLPVPGRYSVRYQFEKRFIRAWRGRRMP